MSPCRDTRAFCINCSNIVNKGLSIIIEVIDTLFLSPLLLFTAAPSKFKQLFGELLPTQLKIINDKNPKYIVVAAEPGSDKTRILVHKLVKSKYYYLNYILKKILK